MIAGVARQLQFDDVPEELCSVLFVSDWWSNILSVVSGAFLSTQVSATGPFFQQCPSPSRGFWPCFNLFLEAGILPPAIFQGTSFAPV